MLSTPGPYLPRTPLSRRLCIRHRELDPAGLEVTIGLLRSDDRHARIEKDEVESETSHEGFERDAYKEIHDKGPLVAKIWRYPFQAGWTEVPVCHSR